MRYVQVSTPVGRLLLTGDEAGLRTLSFQGKGPPAGFEGERDEGFFREAVREIEAYFAGKLRDFAVPLAPRGTPFQQEVWRALRTIPYGETVSYGQLAERIGRGTASRAVGHANGRNPIPILIPCHRVIGSDGSLTGFGGGLSVKRKLLALEGALSLDLY